MKNTWDAETLEHEDEMGDIPNESKNYLISLWMMSLKVEEILARP